MAAAARLLLGGPLQLAARKTNVSIAKLAERRGRGFGPERSEREQREEEIAHLKSKVGEIATDSELLYV
jgi:hypothetical protein